MRESLALLVVLLLAASASGRSPEVESRIAAQDRLDLEGDRTRLLNQARAAVSSDDTAMNRYLLGRAYGLAGELESAREQFDWAIERDPSFAYSYHGLGIFHMVQGNPDEALRQFRTALRLDPELTRARADIARIHLKRGEPLAAEREFQEVLRLDPDNLDVRYLLGAMYLKEKRYDRAIQEFQVVLAKDESHLPARKGYALALNYAKRTDAAIREFERYLAANPKDYDTYLFLVRLYMAKDDRESAIGTLERLKKVAPEDAPFLGEVDREIERIREGRPPERGGITFDDLLGRLDSDDVEVRRETMRTLCEFQYSRLPRRMVSAVTDPDVIVRTLVVRKLGETSREEAIPLLEILLLHPRDRDAEPAVRAAAAAGIGNSGSAAAIPLLLDALSDGDYYVQKIVVDALRRFAGRAFAEDPEAPPPPSRMEELAAAWRDWWKGPGAFALKLDAIEAIEKLDFARGTRRVADLIADAEKPVALAAYRAFVTLTGKAPGEPDGLDTPEGRGKLRDRAIAILEGE